MEQIKVIVKSEYLSQTGFFYVVNSAYRSAEKHLNGLTEESKPGIYHGTTYSMTYLLSNDVEILFHVHHTEVGTIIVRIVPVDFEGLPETWKAKTES